MPTSGIVSALSLNQRKIIDHAARRAGIAPEQMSGENLEVAQDLIGNVLDQWVNAGYPLWTRQYNLLSITTGSPEVSCPLGTVDVMHCYWRILNLWRGAAMTSAGADASVLFGGQPNSDVVITGTNPGVTVNFGTATELDTIGVLLGNVAPVTTALVLLTSPDGVTFTQAQTLPSATYTAGQWVYFDLDPSLTAQYVTIQMTGAASWTLNQLNFGLANGQDIELGAQNIDDYWNLPNKQMQEDRPNTAYTDRQINAPVLKIWPTPNQSAFYNGTVTALTRRYVQDVGALTNYVELPKRGNEALIWRLANLLIYEFPDQTQGDASQASYFTLMAKQQRIQQIAAEAKNAEALFWAEERTRGPVRLMPNIRAYTR